MLSFLKLIAEEMKKKRVNSYKKDNLLVTRQNLLC